MVLEPSSPGSQFLFPEPSRRINTLKNSVSQEPLTENNSRASPGPLGRSPDHSKRSLALSRHLPMAPPAQPGCDSVSESQLTAGLYCSWKLSSPGEINMTQMALSWKKSSSLQNPQVSTVRETDPGCQCECYCPQLQGQAWELPEGGSNTAVTPPVPALVRPFCSVTSVIREGPGCSGAIPQPATIWIAGRKKVRGSHGPANLVSSPGNLLSPTWIVANPSCVSPCNHPQDQEG